MDRYPFLVEEIIALAKVAGETAMKVYRQDFAVYRKADASPVTEADVSAEKVIFTGLKALTPDIPAVGEEHVAEGEIPVLDGRYFWLVDPIDGTEEFVKKNGEFTVNIGLIDGNMPVFGVVYAPAIDELYFTQSPNQAFQIREGRTTLLKTRRVPAEGYTVLISRSHYRPEEAERLVGRRVVSEFRRRGSSLKFCDIAAPLRHGTASDRRNAILPPARPARHGRHTAGKAGSRRIRNGRPAQKIRPRRHLLRYRRRHHQRRKNRTGLNAPQAFAPAGAK